MKKIYLLIILNIILLLSIVNAQEISKDEAFKIAESLFQQEVPTEAKSEYKLVVSDKTTHPYLYEFMWSRYINGVVHNDDRYVVKVDERDGSIFQKYLTYSGPTSKFDTIPTLTANQAKWIVENNYGKITKEPYLLIRDKSLVWSVSISGADINVDANTGETKVVAVAAGSNINEITTKFNPTQYYLEIYGKYLIFMLPIIGIIYWRRKDIFKLFRR